MFTPVWRSSAVEQYMKLRTAAEVAKTTRTQDGRTKTSRQEGLFHQVNKTLRLLLSNPKHPGLHTHAFDSIADPYDKTKKVFEAYAQNNSPGAYRIFWCYGPGKSDLTIVAITPHP